ncbi:SGNH/GDSL hydrolase family protein [Kocuria sp. CPCC 205300]|uniref:SGNH/GDSL hydrolase family protein n=1 Tax=Kocuria sabuli TaxID=3071448 RepID=UPI0036DE01F1
MSASLPRRAASAVATAAALALLGAAPATAHQAHGAGHHGHGTEHHRHGHGHGHPKQIDYVNLGDSYSAAIGTGGVVESPPGSGCYQGDGPDHVSALDAKKRVDLLLDAACAGATTSGIRQVVSSPAVTAALAEAELVTLTLGGNDVGWIEIIRACSLQGSAPVCDGLIADAPQRIEAAAASAGETVAAVDARTRGQVVVLGYPELFSEDPKSPLISAQRAEQLNDLTEELNDALEEAVEQDDAAEFVDVAPRFEGHAVDSGDPWIYYDPAAPGDPNNLHPTERGYLFGYYKALKDEIGLGHLARH